MQTTNFFSANRCSIVPSISFFIKCHSGVVSGSYKIPCKFFFGPDDFSSSMQCLFLRILVGPTRGSSVGLAPRPSTMFSVLLFLVPPSGRMSVGIAYTATSPIRLACARTGELLARKKYVQRPRCLQIPSSWSFLAARPSRMTLGIGHALASRLGLLDHVQLPRLRLGSISQDLALLTDCYELDVHLKLASSSMKTFRPIQRCHWLGAFLASIC